MPPSPAMMAPPAGRARPGRRPAPARLRAGRRRSTPPASLFDGHNDLPWRLRAGRRRHASPGSTSAKRLDSGQTDIPRLREGGSRRSSGRSTSRASTRTPRGPSPSRSTSSIGWSSATPTTSSWPYSADDVERIVKAGKIASLIGIEGGVAIENDLAQLRAFTALGARYMTLDPQRHARLGRRRHRRARSTTASPRSASGSSAR